MMMEVPLRIGGWVGLGGLVTYGRDIPTRSRPFCSYSYSYFSDVDSDDKFRRNNR